MRSPHSQLCAISTSITATAVCDQHSQQFCSQQRASHAPSRCSNAKVADRCAPSSCGVRDDAAAASSTDVGWWWEQNYRVQVKADCASIQKEYLAQACGTLRQTISSSRKHLPLQAHSESVEHWQPLALPGALSLANICAPVQRFCCVCIHHTLTRACLCVLVAYCVCVVCLSLCALFHRPGDDLTCTGKITAVFCNETSDGDISQIAYFNSALSGTYRML